MCSIAGFYCYNENRPSVATLKGLMIAAQTRGKSAAGMAFMNADKQIMIRKQEGPAENFVKNLPDEAWEEVARSPIGLLHARAMTKGSEKHDENNHPVSKYGWVVVHNGHITNDDELFSYYKEPRYAEVDTAAIPLVLKQGTTYEDSLRHLSIFSGQASIAAWSLDEPDKIALIRLGNNEVYLFFDPSRQIMYWCSTPIGGRAIPGFFLGNIAFFTVARLHDGKVMILERTEEKARLLKIERLPFLARKSYTMTVAKTAMSPMRHGGGESANIQKPILTSTGLGNSVRGITHGKDPINFEWGAPTDNPAKPGIDHAGVDNKFFDWDNIIGHFRTEHCKKIGSSTVTLPTAYGRWIFTCSDTSKFGVFNTTFLPARRIKKYWRRHWDTEIPETKLPTKLGVLDGKMKLEEFVLVEKTKSVPPGTIAHMGYMCPWCGLTMRVYQWVSLERRCSGCGIQARRTT